MSRSTSQSAKCYFAYIRVSTPKQGHGVSLQEQRASIVRFAERSDLRIVQWFEERETAAKGGRRFFGSMLKQLRTGNANGVIIHKIDRSARNLKDWAELGQLVDQGIEVHFCSESLDLQSRGGRLSADIQAVVAADYIRNLREETLKGINGRLKQGLYPFRAPLGYLDNGGGKAKTLDPVRAPHLKWAYIRYAEGAINLFDLGNELYARGLRNLNGEKLSLNGLSRILNNPFYAGIVQLQSTGESFAGIHEPLVSVELFERVQSMLAGKRKHCVIKHEFLFRHLLTCRHCRKTLTGERQRGHVYYRCHTRECPTLTVREENVEHAVEIVLKAIQLAEHEADEIGAEIEQFRGSLESDRQQQVASLKANLALTQTKLDRLVDVFVEGNIDAETFRERKGRLISERQKTNGHLEALQRNPDHFAGRIAKFLEHSKTAYDSYILGDRYEKREILELVTSNRWVHGKSVVIEPRIPFLALANWRDVTIGDPREGALRTFRINDNRQNIPEVPELPSHTKKKRLQEFIQAVALCLDGSDDSFSFEFGECAGDQLKEAA